MTTAIVITGTGLAVSGAADARALLRVPTEPFPPVDPAVRIGGKGLRYKDRASQLAMCAAGDALRASGLLDPGGGLTVPAGSVAVVASSNTGNLDTVCLAAELLNAESTDSLSPMNLPNASSNVIASCVALRFGLRGPNLMLCNGPGSGLDAVYWATAMLAASRCERVIIIGAEPANAVVAKLAGVPESGLLDGAAAVVIETATSAAGRAAQVAARLGSFARARGLGECVTGLAARASVGAWFTPERYEAALLDGELARYDLSAAFGQASGALGVLQCVAAVGYFAADGTGAALLTNGETGGAACGLLLHPPADDKDGE